MRAALCFPFALFAASAPAGWVNVAGPISWSSTSMWQRFARIVTYIGYGNRDYKQRRNEGLMSRRVLNEFDCGEERVRVLSMFNHLEPMASGPALLLGNIPCISTNVSHRAPAEIIFNIFCAYLAGRASGGRDASGVIRQEPRWRFGLIAAGQKLALTDSSVPNADGGGNR